jgi:hypothetical protein
VSPVPSSSSSANSPSSPSSLSDSEPEMADSDPKSLTPPSFRGSTSEDAAEWWRQFDNYCTYKGKAQIGPILALFAVLMRDTAADWYEALTAPTTKNELHDAFVARFVTSELKQWKQASDLWSRKQQSGESGEDYLSAMIKAAKQAGMTDDKMIRFAVVKGLRPNVRAHVLQSTVTDTASLLKAVRVGELADETPGDPALHELVTELRANQAEVKRLASKLEKSSVAALTDRSLTPNQRSPSPRHVSFLDNSRRPSSQERPYRDNRRTDSQQVNRSSPWNGRSRAPSSMNMRMPNQQNAGPPPRNPNTASYQPRPATDTNQSSNCYRCGKPHSQAVTCRAMGVTCFACGKQNHFSRVCRSAQRPEQPRP